MGAALLREPESPAALLRLSVPSPLSWFDLPRAEPGRVACGRLVLI